MAVEKVITTKFQMKPEDKKVIENMDGQIVEMEKALDGLEAAGMDVSSMRSELLVTKQRRDALLKYFG